MFGYVSLEQRVPRDHPLRPIREMVDEALRELSTRFERLYARTGRPSIPPERIGRRSGKPHGGLPGKRRKNETHASTTDP